MNVQSLSKCTKISLAKSKVYFRKDVEKLWKTCHLIWFLCHSLFEIVLLIKVLMKISNCPISVGILMFFRKHRLVSFLFREIVFF